MVNRELTTKYLADSLDNFNSLWRKFVLNYMPITNFEEPVFTEVTFMFNNIDEGLAAPIFD